MPQKTLVVKKDLPISISINHPIILNLIKEKLLNGGGSVDQNTLDVDNLISANNMG